MTARRISLARIATILVLLASGACREKSAPTERQLSGEFALVRIGEKPLPVYGMTYPDSCQERLDHGSLRFLSRGRLTVAATTTYLRADGTFCDRVVDSAVFKYVRVRDMVQLEFQDIRGTHFDTLRILEFGESTGLRVESVNYYRYPFPDPLILGGLYLQ